MLRSASAFGRVGPIMGYIQGFYYLPTHFSVSNLFLRGTDCKNFLQERGSVKNFSIAKNRARTPTFNVFLQMALYVPL